MTRLIVSFLLLIFSKKKKKLSFSQEAFRDENYPLEQHDNRAIFNHRNSNRGYLY